MAIADTSNTANSQTCNYVYDDLERASSGLCSGSLWGQDFTYDVFGNISKSIPSGYTGITFNPSYTSGNRITGVSYDGDGHVTNDGTYTYTYNAEGRMATVSGTTAVYDAFTRLVELQASSGTQQLVYAPDGFKFAYMNGQTVQKYIAPLTAGLQAVYLAATPAAPAFWRHSDWQGTARMDSTPAQTVYFDGAYGPFGEQYAGQGTSDRVFTGQTADMLTGRYEFPYRQYNPGEGRWMVPDPAGLGAVDLTNPQTWNRYAYVANNPLSYIDPLGLHLDCGDPAANADDPFCDGDNAGGGDGGGDSCAYDACVVAPPPDPVSPVDTGVSQPSGVNLGLNVIWSNLGGVGARCANYVMANCGAANNGTNCTVGPASAGQYVAATAQVAAMTAQFFSGLGPSNLTFAPNSATSQVMAQSGSVQSVMNSYNTTGQTSGLYTFGLSGLVSAGANPVAQFVGSFRWSITPVDGGINLSLTNTTSFRSLTYDAGPQWQRGSFPTPMGNTHQTFNITATCQ